MKHPNTFAALVAGGITIGAQWLVQRYAHVQLTGYWKDAFTVGTTGAVLYVGKNGVKAALQRIWNGPRKAWSGVTKTASTAKATS